MSAVGPADRDSCEPGDDSNCNGIVNDSPCTCLVGETRACAEKLGLLGNCANGSTTCVADGMQAKWGPCSIAPAAADEDGCTPGDDADCDGTTANENCPCLVGQSRACGPCLDGVQRCSDKGSHARWGACEGATEQSVWYADRDGDGCGDPNGAMASCVKPDGYVANNRDCCDADSAVRPGAECSFVPSAACGGSLDYNCDGLITMENELVAFCDPIECAMTFGRVPCGGR